VASCCEHGDEPCGIIKCRAFFGWLSNYKFVKNDSTLCSSIHQTASSGTPNCTPPNAGLITDSKTIDKDYNEGRRLGTERRAL
jgi:hypothetical protein